MDLMSDPDAIEKFFDGFRGELDYRLRGMMSWLDKRRRLHELRPRVYRNLEVESVRRMRTTGVDAIGV